MIPSSLIPDLRALRPERPAEEVFLYARLIWRFTADHVREIEVRDEDQTVHPLRDIVDFDRGLRQLANAARRAESLQPALDLTKVAAGGLLFTCKARFANTGANDPQECDWPFCGCDPAAEKVIEALQESGCCLKRNCEVSPHPDPPISEGGAVRADQEEGEDCADGKGVKDS